MLKDLKQAARMLLQTKGWTAIVLVSLALGIGANTALFTAVNGVLLQTVPVAGAASLVRLKWTGQNDMVRSSSDYGFSRARDGANVRSTFSYPMYQELRKANTTLTDLAACAPIGGFNVVINGEADFASGFGVTGNYFQLLRVPAALGRMLNERDDQAGAAPVAVISDAFWRKRFSADPAAIGRVVSMNNLQVEIVGVTRPEFTGIQRLGALAPDVTVPLAIDSQINVGQTRLSQPTNWFVQIFGPLKPGGSHAQVQANLEGVFVRTARAGMEAYMASLTPEQRGLSTNRRDSQSVPALLVSSGERGIYDLDNQSISSARILSAVVVVILLIVCANVANLLLSRATSRRKEISVRLSLGATRGRLIRQLLTESLLLSTVGGGLGLLVGYWSRQLLPFGQTTPVDWKVFGFVAGLSLLTGLVFGLAPAFRATRVDLAGVMKENSRSVSSTRSILSKGLLVVQVALSLVLLIGAGLFLRTLSNLRHVDVGFDTRNLLNFSVNPQLNRYLPEKVAQTFRQLQDELRALPGVTSVALTRVGLLSGNTSTTTRYLQGRTESNDVHIMAVSPGFFETMGIPVVAGRGFTDRDVKESPKVAVINETAARKLFVNESPIGRRLGGSIETSGEAEVIGVIRDTKYTNIREAAPPTLYESYLQGTPRAMQFVLRTAGDAGALSDAVRAAVRKVDPNLPITNMATQEERVEGRFAQERLFANAYSLFGGLALLLACIGLFGVMSYNVGRRTNEIGIRMALGARRFDVIRMVLGESIILVAAGIVLGLGAALAAGRFVAQILFGLTPTDVWTLASAMLLILIVSTLAGYLPARRASRVDPNVALHHE